MKKLLPVIIAVLGLGGGIVGGTMFKPVSAAEDGEHSEASEHGDGQAKDHATKKSDEHGEGHEDEDAFVYHGLEKPFFAPVTQNDGLGALVRLDIHLEIPSSMSEDALRHEPKLRDAFLKAVLGFSQNGGFDRLGTGAGFADLRDDLLVSAREVLGPDVKAVLIGEILTRSS